MHWQVAVYNDVIPGVHGSRDGNAGKFSRAVCKELALTNKSRATRTLALDMCRSGPVEAN